MQPQENIAITASIESVKLPKPRIVGYPFKRSKTAILFLVDTSDPARQAVVLRNIEHIKSLLSKAKPHHKFGLASFDAELRIEAPIGSAISDIHKATINIKASGKTTELYRNTLSAVHYLESYPADRKAIFLFSDGLAEDTAYNHADVVNAAKKANVILYGIGYARSVSLSVALQTLRRLSDETGGQFIKADEHISLPDGFLINPFFSLDSGGKFSVDLLPALKSGLFSKQKLSISIFSNNQTLSSSFFAVKIPEPKPEPEPEKTVEPVIINIPVPAPIKPAQTKIRNNGSLLSFNKNEWIFIGSAGILLICAIVYLFMFRSLSRQKQSIVDVHELDQTLACLELLDGSDTRHSIKTHAYRIGRHPDNDLMIDDATISRHHAEVIRKRDGTFTITDLDSMNGIIVNDQPVKHAFLSDGDEVEIGDFRFIFRIEGSELPSDEATVMIKTKQPMTEFDFTE